MSSPSPSPSTPLSQVQKDRLMCHIGRLEQMLERWNTIQILAVISVIIMNELYRYYTVDIEGESAVWCYTGQYRGPIV